MKGAVMVSLKLRKTLILILKLIKFIIRALTKPASQVRTKKNRLRQQSIFNNFTRFPRPHRRCAVLPSYLQELAMKTSIHKEGNSSLHKKGNSRNFALKEGYFQCQ